MTTLTVAYHPAWDIWTGHPADPPPGQPTNYMTTLALALALAIAGLAIGQTAAVTVGASLALVALPFATVGLWIALTILVYEIGGPAYEEAI